MKPFLRRFSVNKKGSVYEKEKADGVCWGQTNVLRSSARSTDWAKTPYSGAGPDSAVFLSRTLHSDTSLSWSPEFFPRFWLVAQKCLSWRPGLSAVGFPPPTALFFQVVQKWCGLPELHRRCTLCRMSAAPVCHPARHGPRRKIWKEPKVNRLSSVYFLVLIIPQFHSGFLWSISLLPTSKLFRVIVKSNDTHNSYELKFVPTFLQVCTS